MPVIQNLATFNPASLSVAQNVAINASLPILNINETVVSAATIPSGVTNSQVFIAMTQDTNAFLSSVEGYPSQEEQQIEDAFSLNALKGGLETSVTAKNNVVTSSKPFSLLTHLIDLKSTPSAVPQANVRNKRDVRESATASRSAPPYNDEKMRAKIAAFETKLNQIPRMDQWGGHQLKYEGELIPLIREAFQLIVEIADHNDTYLGKLYDLIDAHRAGFKHVTYVKTYESLNYAYQEKGLMVNGRPKSPLSDAERVELETSGYYTDADKWATLHKHTRWVEATRTDKAKYRILAGPHVIPKEQIEVQYPIEEMAKTAMFAKFGYRHQEDSLPAGWHWNKKISGFLVRRMRRRAREQRADFKKAFEKIRSQHSGSNQKSTLASMRDHVRKQNKKNTGYHFQHYKGRIWSAYGVSAYVLENKSTGELVLTIGGTTAGKNSEGGAGSRLMSNFRSAGHQLIADLALFWGRTHRIFDEAATLAGAFQDYAQQSGRSYKIVGHSLGGALAAHGACMHTNPARPYKADTIGSAPSNRGMKLEIIRGNPHLMTENNVQQAIDGIRNIVIMGDPISTVSNWFDDHSLIGKVYKVEVEAPFDQKGGIWRHSNYDHILKNNHIVALNRTTIETKDEIEDEIEDDEIIKGEIEFEGKIVDEDEIKDDDEIKGEIEFEGEIEDEDEIDAEGASQPRRSRRAVRLAGYEAPPPAWLDDFEGQPQELDAFIQGMQKKPESEG